MMQQTLERPWYIVVEGAIGVGKTTLARMLREIFDTHLILEVFEENPFLARFYESRARYAFQTQMFFLLSRYRQQQQNVWPMLGQTAVIADYMFAKDRLFARLNLSGDEWDVYQQIHTALTEQIANPDLIIYLQADTDVLMGRIAQRDRPYERDMDRGYINTLRQVYEEFFAHLQDTAVLLIDTNPLNFVANEADFDEIVGRVRNVLQEGVFQPKLPQMQVNAEQERRLTPGSPIGEFQRFHHELDRAKGFNTNIFFNYLCLSEEVGELGSELAQIWRLEESLTAQGKTAKQARAAAQKVQKEGLESELADCMAYLLKIANYAGIDLEQAYLDKMAYNQQRAWAFPSGE